MHIFPRTGFVSVQSCRLDERTKDVSISLCKKKLKKNLKPWIGQNVAIVNSASDYDNVNKKIWAHSIFQNNIKQDATSSNLLISNLSKSSSLYP